MAGAVGGRVLIAMLLVLGLLQNAAATVYTVGQPGSNGGWTYVTSGAQSYDDQFKNTNLVVGDVLSFVFVNGAHNLLEVPAADVSTCVTSSATQTFNSSANITLTTTGSHGFICGFPTHCSNSGMQLLVTVNAAAAAPGAAPEASPAASPKASPGTSPVASPKASPVTSPVASPKASPATSPVASPKASPKASPAAAPKSSSSAPPAPPTPPTGPAQAPGNSAASVLQTGSAMAMGALLAACAVLAL